MMYHVTLNLTPKEAREKKVARSFWIGKPKGNTIEEVLKEKGFDEHGYEYRLRDFNAAIDKLYNDPESPYYLKRSTEKK